MKAKDEFKAGKHGIRWVDPDFTRRFGEQELEPVKTLWTFQKLERVMEDAEIESELKPGICTLGDVLAVLQSNDKEFKDGKWNVFYFEACVVSVGWGSVGWYVYAWGRGDGGWGAGHRVFSPATGNSAPVLTSRAGKRRIHARA